jgi:hypothetical protein
MRILVESPTPGREAEDGYVAAVSMSLTQDEWDALRTASADKPIGMWLWTLLRWQHPRLGRAMLAAVKGLGGRAEEISADPRRSRS